MSWYVGHDGRQVWVDARETVFTCDKPEDDLPTRQLTYLASNLQKTVFAEHAVDDLDGKKGKKKDKQAGRQRGFIVRVDQDERVNVLPSVQAAVDKLQSSGAVSRVDLDETEGKKRNKKGRDNDEALRS
ncbi:SAMS2 [Symbiodinium necroappetens]|uniref:SAMS2 protein n=1 Tax=Symbiodinium necroappetens TaxID=1628268 RepID=A0A812TX75_9DINO|nr:SAMS2 [Symbiodinium necroappetens]